MEPGRSGLNLTETIEFVSGVMQIYLLTKHVLLTWNSVHIGHI